MVGDSDPVHFLRALLRPWRFFGLGRYGMVYLFGITAIGLTILAIFSVGGIFIFSGIFVLLGLLLLAVELLTQQKNRTPH